MDPRSMSTAGGRKGFPRRRGDGPSAARNSRASSAFPPQARGWTPAAPPRLRRAVVSPAGAGMDPRSRSGRAGRSGFPRRRGDGPDVQAHGVLEPMFPPQARGWTHLAIAIAGVGAVSPAGAGMDRRRRVRTGDSSCFPRRRGDGPRLRMDSAHPGEFPPQARGWTHADRVAGDWAIVSPAGAGMDRPLRRPDCPSRRFPRRRGDGPEQDAGVVRLDRFPPQARGWTVGAGDRPLARGVSPAGAGMDRTGQARGGISTGFPRRRGDGP